MISSMTSGNSNEDRTFFGLARNHIYTVFTAMEVGDWKLVRCRNPWGRDDYKGPFYDFDKDVTGGIDSRWNTIVPGTGITYRKYMEDRGLWSGINDGIIWIDH